MSRKKDGTRNRILQSAWKLLENGGGGDVRMSDIAKDTGISRQALYLHFPNRADLLVATTKYLDEVKNVDQRLAKSRAATSGVERLDYFIDAWGNYIPEIYGMAKALWAMMDTDDEARAAWENRMNAVRHGCEAAVNAIAKDKQLTDNLTKKQAIDLLWTLLSVRNWEQLTIQCGWSQKTYIRHVKKVAKKILLSE